MRRVHRKPYYPPPLHLSKKKQKDKPSKPLVQPEWDVSTNMLHYPQHSSSTGPNTTPPASCADLPSCACSLPQDTIHDLNPLKASPDDLVGGLMKPLLLQ